MSNYTPSKVYINKERQQIAMDNASDDSARYPSSDDSERIRNKKDKAAKVAAANASSTLSSRDRSPHRWLQTFVCASVVQYNRCIRR